jgi:glycosyltransferase 2 family protein
VLLFTWLFVGGSSWMLRAVRWRLLLTAQSNLAFWPVFWANSAGNLANNVLPARAGEFIRAAMVGVRSGLTQRFILATAACERVLDLLVFVSLADVIVWYAPGIPPPILRAMHIAFLTAVGCTTVLILASRSSGLVHFLVARGLCRPNTAARVQRYLEPVLDGLRTIHSQRTLGGFIVLSVFIWVLDVSAAKLVGYAMGFSLPYPLAFVLTAGLVFISLIPATPGQLGVYQWVVIQVLAISRIEYNQALAYGVVLQACSYASLTLLGVPGLLLYRRSQPKGTEVTIRVVGAVENSQWIEHPQ